MKPPLYLARTRDPGALEHIMENLKNQLEQIGAEMSARRHLIPQQNRRKYDIEAKDYFENLSSAAEKNDISRFNDLAEYWQRRNLWLTTQPHCYLIPPSLVRKKGETKEQYMDRCYNIYWKEHQQ
ncbi:MAG: hypothetical protein J5858_05610 [Lentisphaeria bacterium]|nr:hypothetical protein [Lentisphaeria bacterium]